MFLLDEPDRFRSKLGDVFLLYWMTDAFQYGPAAMRQRLVELLDPPTFATIATGPHPVVASDLIHILPGEIIVQAADWLVVHWPELDGDVAKESLDKLTDVAPELAERLAIDHVGRIGDKFPEDIRDLVCLRALGHGRSEEGLIVGQQLVDRFLSGSRPALKAALLGLCLKRDLPGGPAVILQELRLARDKRQRDECLRRLLDLISGPLDFEFVVDHVIVRHEPTCLTDLRPLIDPRADLKALVRILRRHTSKPVADLIDWARDVFGRDDRSTAIRLLEEAHNESGLDIELVTLATCVFLSQLVVRNPPLESLSLDRVVRMVARPIDLYNFADPFANRLRAFPPDQVLRALRNFLAPGDEPDPLARYNSLAILRELAIPESFTALLEQLGREPDDPAVDYGASALVALGEPAAERLVQHLRDLPVVVQIQVCRVVARTGGPGARTLVAEWLPRATGQLRAELCDIIEFWPDPSYVTILEPAEPGADLAADDALVMLDLVHGIESPRTAARRETLLKEDESFVPHACPHCGHKAEADEEAHADHEDDGLDDDEEDGAGGEEPPQSDQTMAPVRLAEKVGRNDPCPCGSGKKYKKCCLNKPAITVATLADALVTKLAAREWSVEVECPPAMTPRPGTVEAHADIPNDLRRRLERARLETLVLMRSLDRLHVYPTEDHFPPELRALFELDADCAEGLWALDQRPGKLNISSMLRDTLGSLGRLPTATAMVLCQLDEDVYAQVESIKDRVAATVDPDDAYNMVKGRDPDAV